MGNDSSLPSAGAYKPLTEEAIARICEAVGEDACVNDSDELRELGHDASEFNGLPLLVVEAVSAHQVQALLRLANALHFPVTPRGSGTGLTGGAVPLFGGVVLSLARMNRILSIDRENLITVVQPGVINMDLKKAVQREGLFYPPDPASLDTCSVGGNAATNAAGPSCIKYGTTCDYVLGLEAVLPSGELIRTGCRTRKGVVGYDLTHLLVGSEGTLGVITELVLRLIPHPPAVTTLVGLFPRLSAAMGAVASVLGQGHIPCAMEFMDRHCLELVGDCLPFEGVQESGAFLLVEIDGVPDVIQREIEAIGEICLECEAVNVLLAPDSHKRSQMWDVRKEVSLRVERHFPLYIPEDIVVPIGRIAEFVEGLPEMEQRYGMKIYSFGHAGDGNIHLNITAEDRRMLDRVEEGITEILKRVLAMGGTISGEHGIGMAKRRYLPLELSPESIRIQREIKKVFDPHLILNPGKIF
ncbi:FAD-binding oxidoreductase [Desulforhabdus sp. TSK]|uniref:FAD-binding oxidoreductase n=1 Tax=Desulforhabdus sp. TSK TaxID=2925014 RepID=UPI001FC82F8C|nr:FAD-linked oxidase C-terminal domain-containing protein [Desulforhabdus sp. TSK]GKT08005.1 glycolate oxidase [Desulforhabdus sp. TSK]